MQLVSLQDVKKEFLGDILFEHVTFHINEKDRIALIGNNGCGKSTLLKIILGKEDISHGNISLSKNIKIGYLSQEVIENVNNTLLEEALLVFSDLQIKEKELIELSTELSLDPTNKKLSEQYGKKQEIFTSLNGYDYHYKIEMMISKFGFSKNDYNRKINTFSGGERTKIAFLKLLLLEPDLLILDEPTNHLDLATIEWLEIYLKNYKGALLFVSHDRYFIDALSDYIFEIESHKLTIYKGDYENYIEQKKINYEQQLSQYNQQQKEIERMQKFITYFRYKPRFVSRVHDKEKKLERIQKIEKPFQEKKSLNIKFQGESLKGKEMLSFKDVAIGYDFPLEENISFDVFGQDKIAIMGNNGSGKTTFLKLILEELKPLKGEMIFKRQINIGYIDQHHLTSNDETILENMVNNFPTLGEKALRNHLGKFNFVNDDYQKSINKLSGGEKMRLMLSKIILKNYDLLLLDEPTNHLDMVTRQALINALKEYKGTIIFISHDRYFVDEIATHVLYFSPSKVYFNEGGYHDLIEKEKNLIDKDYDITKNLKPQNKECPKEKKTSLKIEEKITALEIKLKELKSLQFLEEYYMDYEKSLKLEKDIKEIETKLKELENLYLY